MPPARPWKTHYVIDLDSEELSAVLAQELHIRLGALVGVSEIDYANGQGAQLSYAVISERDTPAPHQAVAEILTRVISCHMPEESGAA